MSNEYAIVVLAAGESTRMGTPKQLVEYHGRPLVRHAVEAALAAGSTVGVIVVVGANAAAVRDVLADAGVIIVDNPHWREGLGTSIQTGLDEAELAGAKAVALMLADTPLVTGQMVASLAAAAASSGDEIVASRYSGTVGIPAYFAQSTWPALRSLRPDQGCKSIIMSGEYKTGFIDCPEAAVDIDTPADLPPS